MRLYAIALSFMCSMIYIDMTHPSEVMLKSYINSQKIIIFKWFNGFFYALILTLILMLFENIYRFYHQIDLLIFPFFHLFLDQLILYLFLTPLLKLKHQTYGFMVIMFYLFFQYLNDHIHSIQIYALLPFYQDHILGYELAISYKLCYISLGCLIFLPKQRYFAKIKVLRWHLAGLWYNLNGIKFVKRRGTLSPDGRIHRQKCHDQTILFDDDKWVHIVRTFSFLNPNKKWRWTALNKSIEKIPI